MKSRIFLGFMGGFLGGIVLFENFFWGISGVFAVVVVGVGTAAGFLCQKSRRLVFFILLGIFTALIRLNLVDEFPEGETFRQVRGCIVEEVDKRSDKIIYTIEDDIGGRVMVFSPLYPVFEYGQCLTVTGRITPTQQVTGGYENYLKFNRIKAVMNSTDLVLNREKSGNFFYSTIFYLKQIFESKLSEIFPEPYSSFMAGLITGSRRGIPKDMMDDFQRTGLTHIIAISGYNISMMVLIADNLFSFLTRKKRVVAAMILVTIFVILVGASAAVVRAGIMGIVALFAVWYGREYNITISLVFAAFIMNFYNPYILLNDVGFQLSFLATAGVVYVYPLIEKRIVFLPNVFSLRESLGMTLAAQTLVLPVLVFQFGGLSLISPLANVLVLPFIPFAMMFGFFATVCGFLNFWLGLFVGAGGYAILKYITLIVHFLASFKWGYVEI